MKTTQISTLLAGTVMLLGILTFSLHARTLGSSGDEQKRRLSDYLMDTDFLEQCAHKHSHAITHSRMIAPEIRTAILELAGADH